MHGAIHLAIDRLRKPGKFAASHGGRGQGPFKIAIIDGPLGRCGADRRRIQSRPTERRPLSKARVIFLGILPEIDRGTTPAEVRGELEKCLEKVVSSTHGLDPGATIDCCRHALAIVFGHLCGDRTLDLVQSIEKHLKSGAATEGMLVWAGRIVARLHARTKPNEAQKRPIRHLDDGDSALAVDCLGAVLKDLGWGKAS